MASRARAVRAPQKQSGGGVIGRRRVRHGDFKEAVMAAGVLVIPDDLARGVDAECNRVAGGRGIVESGVGAAAVKEAMDLDAGVPVPPDHLARVVDARQNSAVGPGQWIVESGVGAAAVEEAVVSEARVLVPPDHLAGVVDAGCNRAVAGQGIVDGGGGTAVEETAVPLGAGAE